MDSFTTIEAYAPVQVSAWLANLFNIRWELGRYGSDPCDEWEIETLLKYPDGLTYRSGGPQFPCNCCGEWTTWEGEIADFEEGNHSNLCGGSPRCCP